MKKRLVIWAAGAFYGVLAIGCFYLVKYFFGTNPDFLDIWLAATVGWVTGFNERRP